METKLRHQACAFGAAVAIAVAAAACSPDPAPEPVDPVRAAAVAAKERLAGDPSFDAAAAALAHLRAAIREIGTATSASAASLGEVDVMLAARIDDAAASLRTAWDAGEPVSDRARSLDSVAGVVAEELAVDRLRRRSEAARGVAALSSPADDAALAWLPRSKAALAALDGLREERGAAEIADDAAVRAALECARAFASPESRTWSGPQIASALASAPWPPPSASAASAPATRLAEELARGLRRRAVGELRARYSADAGAVLENEAPVLLAGLRAARDRRLGDVSALDVAALQAQIRALFDADGALDRLRAPYGGDAWLRSGPGEPAEPACEACELDLFLVELQRLLRGDGRTAEEGALEVTLMSGEQDPESLWNQREGAYMTLVLHDRKVQRPAIEWRARSVSYTWTFQDARGKHFNMWWSPSAQAEREKDAPFLKLPGTLAPLLLAWLGRCEDGEWRVAVRPQRAGHQAELSLRFGRPVPEIPRALP
jgi:hypothetical protein